MSLASLKQEIFKIKSSLSLDSFLSLGIVTILYYPIINGAIYSVFDRFHLPAESHINTLLYIIDFILIACALVAALKRHFRFIIFAGLAVVVILLAEIAFFPANLHAIEEYMKDFIPMCFPAFIIAFAVDDSRVLSHQLNFFLYIPLFAGLVYGLCAKILNYSMWYGYSMMIPMLLLGIKIIKGYKPYDIALFAVLFVFLMVKASRGSLFIISAVLFLYMLVYTYYTRNSSDSVSSIRQSRQNNALKNRFYLIASVLLLVITAAVLSQPLFQIMAAVLNNFGYSSRTVNVLADQGIFFLAGRNVITTNLLTAISNSPLWGLGLCGDSVFIATAVFKYPPAAYAHSWHYMGNYAHNLILELTSQFGIFLGLGLFVAFVLLLIYAFRQVQVKKELHKFEILLLFSSILISLMVSGSYLITPLFWLLLGLIIKAYRVNHQKIKNQPIRRDIK